PEGWLFEKNPGEILSSKIFHDVVAGLVVRDEERNAKPLPQDAVGGDPAPPGVRLFGAVRHAEHGPAAGKPQPDVTAPPDVSRQDLDGLGLVARAPRQRREAAVLGGDHGVLEKTGGLG